MNSFQNKSLVADIIDRHKKIQQEEKKTSSSWFNTMSASERRTQEVERALNAKKLKIQQKLEMELAKKMKKANKKKRKEKQQEQLEDEDSGADNLDDTEEGTSQKP